MSELYDKVIEIKRQKDEYILPENIKEGITVFDVTGSLNGGNGQIKLFKTIQEMQLDQNAQEGDLAEVYNNYEIGLYSAADNGINIVANQVIVPESITFPNAVPDSYSFSAYFSSTEYSINMHVYGNYLTFEWYPNEWEMYNVYMSSKDYTTFTFDDENGRESLINAFNSLGINTINVSVSNNEYKSYADVVFKLLICDLGLYKYTNNNWVARNLGNGMTNSSAIPNDVSKGKFFFSNNQIQSGTYSKPTKIDGLNTVYGIPKNYMISWDHTNYKSARPILAGSTSNGSVDVPGIVPGDIFGLVRNNISPQYVGRQEGKVLLNEIALDCSDFHICAYRTDSVTKKKYALIETGYNYVEVFNITDNILTKIDDVKYFHRGSNFQEESANIIDGVLYFVNNQTLIGFNLETQETKTWLTGLNKYNTYYVFGFKNNSIYYFYWAYSSFKVLKCDSNGSITELYSYSDDSGVGSNPIPDSSVYWIDNVGVSWKSYNGNTGVKFFNMYTENIITLLDSNSKTFKSLLGDCGKVRDDNVYYGSLGKINLTNDTITYYNSSSYSFFTDGASCVYCGDEYDCILRTMNGNELYTVRDGTYNKLFTRNSIVYDSTSCSMITGLQIIYDPIYNMYVSVDSYSLYYDSTNKILKTYLFICDLTGYNIITPSNLTVNTDETVLLAQFACGKEEGMSYTECIASLGKLEGVNSTYRFSNI